MRSRRTYIGICCLLFSVMLLAGCTKEEESREEPSSAETKIQIGFTLDSKVLERWIRDINIFTSTAHQLGAEVDVQTASGDVQTQIEQIQHFINLKKDVIVIVATDCNALSDVVGKAKAAGIKIISYDRLIQNVDSDLYISFDNYQVGVLMGENMRESMGQGGKIVMICGPKSDGNALTVEKGFTDAIKDADLEVIEVSYAKGWLPEYAFQAVNHALQGVEDIDGVMCGNDALAIQAIKALAEKRLAGQVYVVGQDADVEACQKVVEGMQTMTVYKDITSLAKKAAEYAVMLAQDLTLDDVTEMVKTGTHEVPQKLLEPIPVTKDNMNEIIIESGFHRKEDVYLNMGAGQ